MFAGGLDGACRGSERSKLDGAGGSSGPVQLARGTSVPSQKFGDTKRRHWRMPRKDAEADA